MQGAVFSSGLKRVCWMLCSFVVLRLYGEVARGHPPAPKRSRFVTIGNLDLDLPKKENWVFGICLL